MLKDAVIGMKHFKATSLAKASSHRLGRKLDLTFVKIPKEELLEISHHCSSLPDLDNRSPNTILGYNEQGLPE